MCIQSFNNEPVCMHILILDHFEDSGMMRCSMILMKYGTLSIELELTQWKLHTWDSQLHIVSTMFILIEHKQKKNFKSDLCTESKQFQEVNFFH